MPQVYVVIKKHCCGGTSIQAIFSEREKAEAYKQFLKKEARDDNPYFDAEIEFLVKEYDLL